MGLRLLAWPRILVSIVLACLGLALTAGGAAASNPYVYFEANEGAYDTCISSLGGGVGQQVKLYTCNVGPNQLFQPSPAADDGTELENYADGLCLSDLGIIGYGSGLYMEKCNKSANQSFYVGLDLNANGAVIYVVEAVLTGNDPPDGKTYAWDSGGNDSQGANVFLEALSQSEIANGNQAWDMQ
jgi:hypothetical protein